MDYEVDLSGNKRLVLMRVINAEAKNIGESSIYITPIVLAHKYGINLQTIQSLLTYLDEHGYIKIEQWPNHDLTPSQRAKLDDEEDHYLISVNQSFYDYYQSLEATAIFHNADKEISVAPDLIQAELSFTAYTIPTVTVDGKPYMLPAMNEGAPYTIIHYCLNNRPNQTLSKTELKEELKASQKPTAGIDSPKENIRKSLFGVGNALNVFIVASSQAILVKPVVQLTSKQLQAIIEASDKPS